MAIFVLIVGSRIEHTTNVQIKVVKDNFVVIVRYLNLARIAVIRAING